MKSVFLCASILMFMACNNADPKDPDPAVPGDGKAADSTGQYIDSSAAATSSAGVMSPQK